MAACELCRRVRSTRRARETTTSKRAIFFLTASRSTRRMRARRVARLRRVQQRRAAPLRVRPSYASAHRAVLVHEQGDAVGRQRRLHWPVTTDPNRSNAHHRHVAHRTLLRTYAPGGTHLAWAHAAVRTAVCSQDAPGPSGALESAHGRPSPNPRLQVFGDLMALVESWEHPVDPSLRLFYSAAWDWRRDLYEQSVRVADKVAQIRDDTGCRPIVAGHSFGARLVHTALARGDLELSGEVAGVMYFAGAFLGTTYLGPGKSPLATCVRARNTAHAKVQEQCSSSQRPYMVTAPRLCQGSSGAFALWHAGAPFMFRPNTTDFQAELLRRTWSAGFAVVPVEPQAVCANTDELLSNATDECTAMETTVRGCHAPTAHESASSLATAACMTCASRRAEAQHSIECCVCARIRRREARAIAVTPQHPLPPPPRSRALNTPARHNPKTSTLPLACVVGGHRLRERRLRPP